MPTSRQKRLHMNSLPETVFGEDRDDTDANPTPGSNHVYLNVKMPDRHQDQKAHLETDYAVGHPLFRSLNEPGPDRWAMDNVIWPIRGLDTFAGVGVNASTIADDQLDFLLTHLSGTVGTTPGEDVDAVADASNLTLASNAYAVHELLALWEAGIPQIERLQVAAITSAPGAGVYQIAPALTDFGTFPLTTAAEAVGYKRYTFDGVGGATRSFVAQDGATFYNLTGGRCTAWSISIPSNGGRCEITTSWRGTKAVTTVKANLPPATNTTPTPTVRATRSPVWLNGARFGNMEVTIDGGIAPRQIMSTEGPEGIIGDEMVAMLPKITLKPRRTQTLLDLKRAATAGPLLIQIGGGQRAAGQNPAWVVYADVAQAPEESPEDDEGIKRQSLVVEPRFAGTVGGAEPFHFQIIRL